MLCQHMLKLTGSCFIHCSKVYCYVSVYESTQQYTDLNTLILRRYVALLSKIDKQQFHCSKINVSSVAILVLLDSLLLSIMVTVVTVLEISTDESDEFNITRNCSESSTNRSLMIDMFRQRE